MTVATGATSASAGLSADLLPVPVSSGVQLATSGEHRPTSFVGTGWSWPLRTDPTGGIAMIAGAAELEQAMYLILATSPGERPMRPEFGSRLGDFVFAPADATTAGLIAAEVRSALLRWEPRVEVTDVVVTADAEDAASLWIDIRYVVLQTYDRRNLVVPFYVIPAEA